MNSPLEAYLDELAEKLKALSIHERLEQVDETRAHLESLILPFEEWGSSREEAESKAIAQFGEVAAIAQQLNRAATRRRWGHLLGLAAIYMGIANSFSMPLYSLFSLGSTLYRDAIGKSLGGGTTVFVFVAVSVNILTGLVAGALLRRLAPGNTLRPLLLVGAVNVAFALRFPTPVGFSVFTQGLWGTFLSLFTSGALEELPDILLRWRRRVA